MLRQNPSNPCILESSPDGQTWTQFADLSGCAGMPGADGADGREVEFNVSTTHIQWRYVGDSTWIDLVTLADLKGVDGIDGQPGADGTDGREVEFNVSTTHIQWRYVRDSTWIDLIALDDLKGEQGETGTNNDLPSTPTLAETDKLCSAATGIADRILALVTDIVNDLATFTDLEVLEALLVSPGGRNGSVLQQLIGLLETADSTTIINEFNAEKSSLIEQLYCSELDKDTAISWAQSVVSWSSVTQSVIGQAIEAVTDGKWALWAFIDADKGLGDCTSFNCVTTQTCWDFANGSAGWGDSTSSGEFLSNRYRMRSNQRYAVGCFRVALVSPTGLNLNNIVGVSIDWDCSGGNSRNNNINQNYIRYVYTDGTQEELNMPNFDIPSSGFVGTQSYSVPQSDPNKTVNQVVIIHREWLPVGGASSTGTIYVDGICLETL